MTPDPYEALQDDLEAMSIANAGLLVEVAELTAIVESVRRVRATLDRRKTVHYRRWVEDDHDADAAAHSTYSDAVGLLDQVDGL